MIDTIRDLEKLLKLCRKQGVTEIDLNGTKIKFGDMPVDYSKGAPIEEVDPLAGFPDGELTPEQLMFYSSGGLPENDPALKAS